jgi:rod shape-determining protein MreD
MQIFAFIIVILLAFIESWLQPWFSVSGVAVPLILIFLIFTQAKIDHRLLPWLGLIAGLVVDLGNAGYFGVNTLYYLVIFWVVSLPLPQKNYRERIWLRISIIIAATLIQPWYVMIANRQITAEIGYNFWVSLVRVGWVSIISAMSLWYLIRKESANI